MFVIAKPGSAQEIYFEIKMDFNVGNLKYKSSDNIIGDQGDLGEVRNFSIGASAQVTEHLFVKSTLSTSNFNSELDVEWNIFGNSYSIDGKIRGQQTMFEFLPEVRLFKNNWFFFNAGIGVSDLTKGEFYQGEATVNGSAWNIKDFRGYNHHFAANIGVNIQREVVGVIVELGYRNSGYLASTDSPFSMGFQSFGGKLGVSYRLRDTKTRELVAVDNL